MALVDKKRSNSHDNHQKKRKKNGGCHVEEEIQREILLRLPVKSVLRFRSVNRKSLHLISSQQFITDHLKTPRQDKDILFLLNHQWCEDHRYRLYLDDMSSVRPSFFKDLAPPYGKTDFKMVRVVDYCNGVVCLICMSSINRYDLMLWNPCLRKSVVTPLAHSLPFSEVYGFGCVNDDYKLVMIPYAYAIGTPLKASVWDSNTRNWAFLTCPWTDPQEQVAWQTDWIRNSVFVNGACHWLARERRDGRYDYFVLSFNLSKYAFGKIALPSYSSVPGLNSIHVHKECIYVVVNKKTGFVVWAMKEYGRFDSWTKIMESNHLTKHIGYVLGFMGGGQLVYSRSRRKKLVTYYQELVCYDPITKESHYWKAKHMLSPVGRLHVYRENLALLNPDVQMLED